MRLSVFDDDRLGVLSSDGTLVDMEIEKQIPALPAH